MIEQLLSNQSNFAQIIISFAIFFSKVAEITLQSLKYVCLAKNKKVPATCLAFGEILIWAFVVSNIIVGLRDNLFWLFSYCIGYALGFYVGSVIEHKISLGNSSIQFFVNDKDKNLIVKYLEEHDYGYTLTIGYGSKEKQNIINIIVKKRYAEQIINEVNDVCKHNIFLIHSDVSEIIGGIGFSKRR